MTMPPPPPPGDPFGRPPSSSVPPPPPTGYPQPSPPGATPSPAVERDGKLIAAGVMSIIAGVFAGGVGVLALVVAIAADGLDDDALLGSGDGWSFLFGVVALFLFVAAALALVAGIGCVRGSTWGKVMALIIWGLSTGLLLLGLLNEPTGDTVVPLVWSGVIVLLTATARPWQ